MSDFYSVIQVVEMMGLRGLPPKDFARMYQRVHQACCYGHAGRVKRIGRGFVLTEKNVATLLRYLRQRWPEFGS